MTGGIKGNQFTSSESLFNPFISFTNCNIHHYCFLLSEVSSLIYTNFGSCRQITGAELTSRLLSVLNSIRSCSLVKASLEYWKLKVENGDSGSSKMSKSAISFSFSVSRGTPVRNKTSKSISLLHRDENRVDIGDKRIRYMLS